jgi:hypothetical protein
MTFKPPISSTGLSKDLGGEKIVVKKTSKSHTMKKAGRNYKVTEIEVTYDNGEVESIVE